MKVRLLVILSLIIPALVVPGNAAASAGGLTVCAAASTTVATCHARVLKKTSAALPAGYGPGELRAAYSATLRGSETVAVVGAYNDAAAKNDLDTYDATYGLGAFAGCSSATQRSCFERLDERGGQNFGVADTGWAVETALDTQTIHQLCPSCRLELVEADNSSLGSLFAAVDEAVATGAKVVSMSWGGKESAAETSYDAHLSRAGVTFVASSGDAGYGVSYPAASTSVIAVGGTSLTATTSGWRAETTWSDAGSGCSKYEPKPSYQHDPGCTHRSVADLSADADPNTGAAVYASQGSGHAGWYTVGGTSLAAPIIAGLLAGSGASPAGLASRIYTSASLLHDIVTGKNGSCGTTHAYLCTAGGGYDGPTGNGTPASSALW